MKITWRLIVFVGLVLLWVGSCVIVAGCGHKTEAEQPQLGPLVPPFSEIIPSAESLLFLPYSCHEETIYHPDGLITYSRIYGNKSASYSPLSGTEKPESPAVVLSLAIRAYQGEEQAKKCIQHEREKKWCDKSASESYARLLGLPLEDVASHVVFWKEPGNRKTQGEEEILFRVGRYVGDYTVHVDDPPEVKDGFFMPPDLRDLLEFAVIETNIPKLRSLASSEDPSLNVK